MHRHSGIYYFYQGWRLIRQPGLRRYVVIPVTVNLSVFGVAFYWLFGQFDIVHQQLAQRIPEQFGWVTGLLQLLLWPLAILLSVMVFALLFSTLANWIAAPFNGLLAAKVERCLRNETVADESLWALARDIPRILWREWEKLRWYLPRAIGFLLLLVFVPIIGQLAWFFFSAWTMSIQYCDYPFDNHKVPFTNMRQALRQQRARTLSFGMAVNLMTMIPIINFLVMPIAVCGATAMWVDRQRD